MAEESFGKKLRKFSIETRFESAQKLKKRLLDMFRDYIKAVVVWGSVTRGDYTGKSDVDIYIIFDDTKMPLKKFDEIRDRVDKDVAKVAKEIDPRLHAQPVIALTEFWDGIRTTHPLFFNIVREGYALYDAGFFIPMRKLLEWGKFPSTIEAAELRMESVPKRVDRVKNVKLYMIAEDLYYSFLDAAQAVLMYLGVGPPPPKVAPREFRKHLVDTGLIEEEYAKMLEDVIIFRKKVEHKELKDISGAEVDEWIKKIERYIERMEKLLDRLQTERRVSDIKKNYEVMVKASVAALKAINKLPPEPEKMPDAFKKYLVEGGLVSPIYADVLGKVVDMRRLLDEKKIDKVTDREVYMNKEYVRRFIMDVRRIVEKGESPLSTELEQESRSEEKMKEAKQLAETAKEAKRLPEKGKDKSEKIEKKLTKRKK